MGIPCSPVMVWSLPASRGCMLRLVYALLTAFLSFDELLNQTPRHTGTLDSEMLPHRPHLPLPRLPDCGRPESHRMYIR